MERNWGPGVTSLMRVIQLFRLCDNLEMDSIWNSSRFSANLNAILVGNDII